MSSGGMFDAFNRPTPSMDTVFKNDDLSPAVQQHLTRVYAALLAGVAVATAGVFTHLVTNLGGLLTTFASIGMLIWLSTEHSHAGGDMSKRQGIFAAFCFLQGMSIGGLVSLFFLLDVTELLLTAFLGTVTVFACFTGAALLANRRSYIYIGGTLGSAVSFLMLLSFMNMFMGSSMVFSAQLYLGLFVFCGYVLFDTQVIVERASVGNRDYVWDAATLFIDFVAIFVRIAIILLRNSQSKKDRRRR